MKRLRRILSSLLLCALLAGLSAVPVSALSDVPEDFWAKEDISRCVALGYFYPEEGGNFGVGKKMSRSEFVVVLCRALGWKPPKYAHTAQLMKIDEETGSKRKLSKRKDPELALSFYAQQGYPAPSVLEYLMTLLNSNFEEWRRANPDQPMDAFPFSTKKMSGSGALFDIDKLKEKLMQIGDSVICIWDLELVKIHVHTNTPGVALSLALELGELDRIKIENMLEENRALKAKLEAEKKEMGMLAICAGKGLEEIFKDLMCDRVIEGGQTMNPSAQDIADAVQKINAANVFVFPNNSNVILAAEQAKDLVTNRHVHVIPTKNVPQGFAAALAFNPEATVPENKTDMTHAIDNVASGQVTYAVRETTMNGFKLKEGDIIGLDNKRILAKGSKIDDTTLSLIKSLKNNDHEMITLYYGEGVTEEDAQKLAEKVSEAYPDCDVDFHYGGQPVYYYMVSLE